jgi:hypothetical protein
MRVIDIHTHGIGGYNTRTTRADDILKIAELHGAHGVTDIVPTIYSGPVQQMRANMAAVKGAMERQHTAVSNRRSGSLDSSLDTQNSRESRAFTLSAPSSIHPKRAPLMGHPFKCLLLKHGGSYLKALKIL